MPAEIGHPPGVAFALEEYTALRATIARRSTVRVVLLLASFTAWAALALGLLLYSQIPLGSLISLAALGAGFEAINALHVGVERVGRYIQVFYEETLTEGAIRPRWETIAMTSGPALPGGGLDPLFVIPFATTTVLNLGTAFVPEPTPLELGVIGVLHVGLVVRMFRARAAATRQRAQDLEHYRRLRHAVDSRQ